MSDNDIFGICKNCQDREINAYFDCFMIGYCDECIRTITRCPVCEKPEIRIIFHYSSNNEQLQLEEIYPDQ